jgi:Sec-independent protein translocase protein TatA
VFGLSTGEIVVVALIVTLVFGWSWFPRIGEKVGDLVGGVKKGMREDDERIVVKQSEPEKKKKQDT